jgi:hypothetical protein
MAESEVIFILILKLKTKILITCARWPVSCELSRWVIKGDPYQQVHLFGCDLNILQNFTQNLLRTSWVQPRPSPDGDNASKKYLLNLITEQIGKKYLFLKQNQWHLDRSPW